MRVIYGRCRSGRRWYWCATSYVCGRDERLSERGWSDNEEQALEDVRQAVVRIAGDRPTVAYVSHGTASDDLKQLNIEERRAKPPSGAKDSRVVEYLYSGSWGGERRSLYRFRITKRTAKRIFYVRKGEWIDESGEPIDCGGVIDLDEEEIGSVNRRSSKSTATFVTMDDTGRAKTITSTPRWRVRSPNTAATTRSRQTLPRSRRQWQPHTRTREAARRDGTG